MANAAPQQNPKAARVGFPFLILCTFPEDEAPVGLRDWLSASVRLPPLKRLADQVLLSGSFDRNCATLDRHRTSNRSEKCREQLISDVRKELAIMNDMPPHITEGL